MTRPARSSLTVLLLICCQGSSVAAESGDINTLDADIPGDVCCPTVLNDAMPKAIAVAFAANLAASASSSVDSPKNDAAVLGAANKDGSTAELQDLLSRARRDLERLKEFRTRSDLFLGIDAEADERVIYRSGLLAKQMSALIQQLETANNRPESTGELQPDQRPGVSAGRLELLTRHLQMLLDRQAECGQEDIASLLGAIQGLALRLDLQTRHQPSVAEMEYFIFAGHLPDVVPREGGQLLINGEGLWDGGQPAFAFAELDGTPVTGQIKAGRAARQGPAVIELDPEWITEQAGRCLLLHLADRGQEQPRWPAYEDARAGQALPVCVPFATATKYRLAGYLEYLTPTRTQVLTAKSILFENPSCTESKEVSATLEWELEPGGWLTSLGESVLYEAGETLIDCQIENNAVSCAGELGPAVCTEALSAGGNASQPTLLLEQTEWEHIFTPAEEFPQEELHRSWSLSPAVELAQPETELSVTIPREEPSETTTIWYELIVVNGGQQAKIFTSPQHAITTLLDEVYVVDHRRLNTVFDVTAEKAAPSIEVRMEARACRY